MKGITLHWTSTNGKGGEHARFLRRRGLQGGRKKHQLGGGGEGGEN